MNDAALTSQMNRLQTGALIVGAITAVVSLVGAFLERPQFFHSYLFAWLFWSGLSFGALVIVLMQALSGGKWGAAVRGLASAGFMTLPLMALLFLPVLIGVHEIFHWSLGTIGEAPGYHHKAQWFNLSFFIGRSAFYFLAVIAIALCVRRALQNNRQPSAALSSGGLIVYILCMNFASTDWVMSLDPQWFSTIFVVIFVAGQFLSALALVTLLLAHFARNNSLGQNIPTKVFHDLGNMLLAFTVFWAYVSFSQFLIIWSGNLTKEIFWYLERSRGGWQWFALALFLLQFLLPFALLLSRERKKNPQTLARICFCILGASVLNNFWLVAPSLHPASVHIHWLDFTEWLALGGFWFAMFFWILKRTPLLAPDAIQILRHE